MNDHQQMMMMLPDLQPDELATIQHLTKDMSEQQRQQFLLFYRSKRKENQTMIILTLIGFLGVAGIQRFVTGQIGMGILFLITFGFCGIGTIVDLINLRGMVYDYNQKQAVEAANMVRMMGS
ncbi:MAG TPA: TM2 domain-containing protein [Phnomibacter sp.]|nr:TM2 domain-containing protein [Phnomibacter sp.]